VLRHGALTMENRITMKQGEAALAGGRDLSSTSIV
jgi:hypothetical protein